MAAPYHHGNLRSALVELAVRRVEEVGVAGVSLRELARDAGVSHGAPRAHFPDKQALLDALAEHGLDLLGAALTAALTDADATAGSVEERLVAFAEAYVAFALDHPSLLSLMFARKDDPDKPALVAANDRAFAAPVALVTEAMAGGELRADEPDDVAMALLAMLHGLAGIVATGMIGARDPSHVVTGTVHLLMAGLRP